MDSLIGKLGKHSDALKSLRAGVLNIAALGFLSAAGYTFHLVAGLAITGVSLFVLDWLTRTEPARR